MHVMVALVDFVPLAARGRSWPRIDTAAVRRRCLRRIDTNGSGFVGPLEGFAPLVAGGCFWPRRPRIGRIGPALWGHLSEFVSIRCAGQNRQGVVGASPMQSRSSEPGWPRVLRTVEQSDGRSVDRGACRAGIEPRKHDTTTERRRRRIAGRQHCTGRHRENGAGSARSKAPHMHGSALRGNRESPCLPMANDGAMGRIRKPEGRSW